MKDRSPTLRELPLRANALTARARPKRIRAVRTFFRSVVLALRTPCTLLLPLFFAYTGLRTNVGLLGRPELILITLGPIFDPLGSGWYWTHDVQNYRLGQDTPRRASIGTNMRMSRGLLEAMNVVNAEAKKSLHCEAWSTTLVLHSQLAMSVLGA